MSALAAVASEKQGMFDAFHEAMFSLKGQVTEKVLWDTAERAGLDLEQLRADMQSKSVVKRVQDSLAVGNDIGVSGTPFYFIGDDLINGALGYEALKAKVAKARAGKLLAPHR